MQKSFVFLSSIFLCGAIGMSLLVSCYPGSKDLARGPCCYHELLTTDDSIYRDAEGPLTLQQAQRDSWIWVKSGPGNNAKIEISQIWVKYGSETAKTKQITICRQCLCFGNMLGSVLKQSYPNMVGEYLQIQNTLFFLPNLQKIDWPCIESLATCLSPWLPV